ncbi:hypothetical protein PO909_002675 [Leuciscus waleckii]
MARRYASQREGGQGLSPWFRRGEAVLVEKMTKGSVNSAARRGVVLLCTPPNVAEDLGPYGISITSTPTRPTAYASCSAVACTSGTIPCMALGPHAYQGGPALYQSPGPLEKHRLVPAGCEHGFGLREEGHFNRRFQLRLGSPVRGQACLRPLVELGETPTHQLPRDESGFSSPKNLPPISGGTTRLGPHGQHVSGLLNKSPGRTQVPKPVSHSHTTTAMGSNQPALTQGSSRAGHNERRSRHAFSGQCSPRRMVTPSPDGSPVMGGLREGRSRPLRLRRQLSLPNLLLKEQGCAGPRVAQPPPLCVSLGLDAPSGHRTDQEHEVRSSPCSPPLVNPDLVPRANAAVCDSSVANPAKERPPCAGKQDCLAPHRPDLWALHAWPLNGYPRTSQKVS